MKSTKLKSQKVTKLDQHLEVKIRSLIWLYISDYNYVDEQKIELHLNNKCHQTLAYFGAIKVECTKLKRP